MIDGWYDRYRKHRWREGGKETGRKRETEPGSLLYRALTSVKMEEGWPNHPTLIIASPYTTFFDSGSSVPGERIHYLKAKCKGKRSTHCKVLCTRMLP